MECKTFAIFVAFVGLYLIFFGQGIFKTCPWVIQDSINTRKYIEQKKKNMNSSNLTNPCFQSYDDTYKVETVGFYLESDGN